MRNRHGSWINRARKSERSLELAMAFQRPPREGLRLGSIRNVRLTRVVDSKKGHTWGTERNEVGSVNILIFRPSHGQTGRQLRIYKVGLLHELVAKNPLTHVETRSKSSYRAITLTLAQTLAFRSA